MDVIETEIPAVKRVVPKRFGDARGWFSETFRADQAGCRRASPRPSCRTTSPSPRPRARCAACTSRSRRVPQAKLIRVLSGAILDVAVDLRGGSPTYGRHVAVTLDAEGGEQLYIPHGFAHGFCTLTPDVMVAYKVDSYYSPAQDRALVWNDPAIGIAWPVGEAEAILSDKDRRAPTLSDLGPVF